MQIRAFVQAWPLSVFFPLAFLLSWYPWLLSLYGVETSGGINPLGVFVAALVLAAAGGRSELKALLQRVIRVRCNWRWYLAALGLPTLIVAVSLGLNLAMGAPTPTPQDWARWPEIVDRFLFGFLFVGLGEEPGWRGYALPELMRKHAAFKASLILGAVWAVWHLPLFGVEFPWGRLPLFVVSVLAGSVVTAWLFISSGQSVFLTMLLHATVNAIGAGYVFRFFTGTDLDRLWWIYTAVWATVAAVLAWRTGPGLQSRP